MPELIAASADLVSASDEVIATIDLDHPGARGVIEVEDPATAEVIAEIPDMDADEALSAVARAHEAGLAWAGTTTRQRADVLHRWYDLLVEHAEDIALLISREMGKPLAEARAEVVYGTDFVRWYAEEAVRPGGNYREAPTGTGRIITRRSPVGLSVLVTPWNFPLAMATRKIAPAIAAGCAAVIKPASLTPLTTCFVVQLASRAGVPDDLVQVVTTNVPSEFSTAVLADRRVRKVSFTGSTGVGQVLLGLAAQNVLKSSMELGGNAPLLVLDDADLDRAVDGAFAAKMRNGGQSCIAANRIYVQDGIADAFVEGLTRRFAEVRLGHGLGEGTTLGPLIDRRAVDQMKRLVADATDRGARLLVGGNAPDAPGSFFEATVLDEVPLEAELVASEIFGPVAAIQRFTRQDEAVRLANDTPFGLAGYVFTQDLDRAFAVADQLETGLVGINQGVPSNAAAPFGGVKHSGLGREGSGEGLEEYQEIRFYNLAAAPS